jgi:ABC-2 type transport system permease protein
VRVAISLAMTLGLLAVCLVLVTWIFRTGYGLKN